jgi:enterochelin esterase-like enzyme
MKLKSIIVIAIIILSQYLIAQQNVGFRQTTLASPIVNENKTVTFKLKAPDAKYVKVKGDWEANNGVGDMVKDNDGVWMYTSQVLPSDMYIYSFEVDSIRVLDPLNAFTIRDVGNNFNVVIINGGDGDQYSVNDVPHGTVSKVWYSSKELKMNRRLTIYTPPGYEEGKMKYPVLYLLHGSGGDEEAWNTLGVTSRIMDNLIASQKIKPMIVVMPNGNSGKQAAPGETSENLSYKPVMNQFLPPYRRGAYEISFDEIVNFIDNRYRTKKQKSQRAIAGLSMGGFHSMIISANHPDLFDYVGLFSPGTNTATLDTTITAFRNIDQKFIMQKSKGYKLYWVAIGKTDFIYESMVNFRKKMDGLNFPYTYVESPRGHIWSNWRRYMLDFTPQLF